MADHKKQHFVPKFYLRNWSPDDRLITMLHLETGKYIPRAPLADQCQENWLYGTDLKIEKALGVIEAHAAKVIGDVIQGGAAPLNRSPDYGILQTFVICQIARTVAAGDALENMTEDFLKGLLATEYGEEALNGARVSMDLPSGRSLAAALSARHFLVDLDLKVLRLACDGEFITSDDPAVVCNPFTELMFKRAFTGFAHRGLQIFLPLDPKHVALFYDSWMYRVGETDQAIVEVRSRRDLAALNALQARYATECLYTKTLGADALTRICRVRSARDPAVRHSIRIEGDGLAAGSAIKSVSAFVQAEIPVSELALGCVSLTRRGERHLRLWKGKNEVPFGEIMRWMPDGSRPKGFEPDRR
ncbi:MAG: DUF4238 domain-containing protein [Phycisphaerales bacterium]